MQKLLLPLFTLWVYLLASGCTAPINTAHDPYAAYRSQTSTAYASNDNPRKIQIALILDTGPGMSDMLEYAKGTFWILTDELLQQTDQYYTPEIEFALYEYGNRNLRKRDQFIRLIVPFTSDLDWISDELFRLNSSSGRRGVSYCGTAIQAATQQLHWSDSPEARKMIIIAGNEHFGKGPVDYRRAIAMAAHKDIAINTLFAGNYRRGIQLLWQDAAFLGNGLYRNIESSVSPEHYFSPGYFDVQISLYNTQLNQTYLPYGSRGNYYHNRCIELDRMASRFGDSYQRIRTLVKCRSGYRLPGWDLIDAIDTGKMKLEDIAEVDLPQEMRGIGREAQLALLERKRKEREEIKARVLALQAQREEDIKRQGGGIREVPGNPLPELVKPVFPASPIQNTGGDNINIAPRTQRQPDTKEKPTIIREPEPVREVLIPRQEAEQDSYRQAEEARQRAEQESYRQAEEARQRTEQESYRQTEEARQRTEQESRRQAEEARQRAEQESRRQAEEARQRAEQESRRQAEEARQRAEQESRRQAEEARQRAEQESRRQAEEARQRAEQESRRQAEEARQRAEQESRRQAEEARQRAERERQMQIQRNNTGIRIE
ncbi:MAG: hypothetical protein R3C61_24175 [Bacteroidia bacterium]